MKIRRNKVLVRAENNLTSKIKGHYPHLFASLGGRYIRRIIRSTQNNPGAGEGLGNIGAV